MCHLSVYLHSWRMVDRTYCLVVCSLARAVSAVVSPCFSGTNVAGANVCMLTRCIDLAELNLRHLIYLPDMLIVAMLVES